jgi:hypothetical protein
MKNKMVVLLSILLVLVYACKEKNNALKEVQQVVSEWTGKEIRFPDNFQCIMSVKDTLSSVCQSLMSAEYKILLYVDSTGCSNCRLKLNSWRHLIEEADSLFIKDKLSFLFFFQPKNRKEMTYLFVRDNFNYPAFIDENNIINQLNRFPEKMEYQCFFLDKENKVMMIGNPTLNLKIWELYKQTISEQTSMNVPLTSISVEDEKLEIKNMHIGKITEATFVLKNAGTQPLVIQMVGASCGCIATEWDKQPIATGKSTDIKVRITPKEKGYFNKIITIHCNTEEGCILLNITGIVND